jgi:hypothetical protein
VQRSTWRGDTIGPRQISALGDFLLFLGDRGPDRTDPRTYALWFTAAAVGNPDNFSLTPTQVDLLARIGTRAEPVPRVEVTFTEFAVAAWVDAVEAVQQKVGAANHERDESDEKASLNASAVIRAHELEDEKEARDVIDGLKGDLAEAQASLEFFRQRGGIETVAPAAPVGREEEGETSSEGDPRRDGPLHHGQRKARDRLAGRRRKAPLESAR